MHPRSQIAHDLGLLDHGADAVEVAREHLDRVAAGRQPPPGELQGWLLGLTLDTTKGDLVTPHKASPRPVWISQGVPAPVPCEVGPAAS
jgi:hypothetical protein